VRTINPQNEIAWFNEGIAEESLQKYSDAINSYSNVVKINPKNEEA